MLQLLARFNKPEAKACLAALRKVAGTDTACQVSSKAAFPSWLKGFGEPGSEDLWTKGDRAAVAPAENHLFIALTDGKAVKTLLRCQVPAYESGIKATVSWAIADKLLAVDYSGSPCGEDGPDPKACKPTKTLLFVTPGGLLVGYYDYAGPAQGPISKILRATDKSPAFTVEKGTIKIGMEQLVLEPDALVNATRK
ncbi:MAG: hypothetical protein QM765_34055 [Myxococcales bacterium]